MSISNDENSLNPGFFARCLRGVSLVMRIAMPIALLAVGGYAFSVLSVEPKEEKSEPGEKQRLRTNVTELTVLDYPVVVHTNGVVQPHNEVTLSAQVSGQITRISPAFEVGSYFKAGEVLIELDASDYETGVLIAEAQKLSAESALELAEQTLERLTHLHLTNNVAEAELNQAVADRKQAAAQWESTEAAFERAQRDLERTKIRAPFDGRVRVQSVGLGQSVGPGTALGVAFAVDFAEIRLPISSNELRYLDLPELEGDETVDVELRDAVNPESETVWRGKIVRTEGTLDSDSLELCVIARVHDPFGLETGHPPLRIGQPVTGWIAGKTLKNVLAVPRMAVRQLDQIFLVDRTELTLSTKTIEPIWSDEDFVIVRDPTIESGSLLSTTQLVYVPEGAKVEIIPDIGLTAAATDTGMTIQDQPLAN